MYVCTEVGYVSLEVNTCTVVYIKFAPHAMHVHHPLSTFTKYRSGNSTCNISDAQTKACLFAKHLFSFWSLKK